jgi:hypothetical protein
VIPDDERLGLEERYHQAFVARLKLIEKETEFEPEKLWDLVKKGKNGYKITENLLKPSKKQHDGFDMVAIRKGKPHLTIEALVIDNEEWHELFTEKQIKEAERRLEKVGYLKTV